MKFEIGQAYLMKHNHYAFGGGHWIASVDAIVDDMICLNGMWHNIETYLSSRSIIKNLGPFETEGDKIKLLNQI